MADNRDRGVERAEAAFAALSATSEQDRPDRKNPWKVAAMLFLVLALALPLVAGVRQAAKDVEWRAKLRLARDEVEAVPVLIRDGNLPEAALALHDVGMRLAAVPGAEAAAFELRDAIRSELSRLEGERDAALAEVGRLQAEQAEHAGMLQSILAGVLDPGGESPEEDPVSRRIYDLVDHLRSLWASVRTTGRARSSGLLALAQRWPVGIVKELASQAQAARNRNDALGTSLTLLEGSLDEGKLEEVPVYVDAVVALAEIPSLPGLLERYRLAELAGEARRLELMDQPMMAAALYRAAWHLGGGADVADKARELSASLGDRAWRERLAQAADRTLRAGRLEEAAAVQDILARETGNTGLAARAGQIRAASLLAQARRHLREGRVEAARALAEEAHDLGSAAAEELLESTGRDLAARAERERRDRARQAAEAGAPELAEKILGDLEPGESLGRSIAAGRREETRIRARALLLDGRVNEALEALAGIGLRETGIVALAEILRGNVEAGLSILPEEGRREALFVAICEWLKTDAARAGSLLAAADDPELQAAVLRNLGRFLDAAEGEREGFPYWSAVLLEAERRIAAAGGMGGIGGGE